MGLAVDAARAAAPGWAATQYDERCRLLRAVADGIGERHMELAALASLETGKSRTESILEVQEAIDLIEAYAGHMEENEGYTAPLNSFVEGERNVDVLRPYGVFGVIAPFNFPVALSIGMASSALIAGNPWSSSPPRRRPRPAPCSRRSRRRAGLPAGVFNLVQGGPDTGRALVDARRRHRVHGLSRGRAGDRPQAAGGPVRAPGADGDGRQEPCNRDASGDVDAAAEGVARSAFGLSGQKCSACSRAIVEDPVYDEFVEKLAARAGEFPLGDPSEPGLVRRPGDQREQRGALPSAPWPRREERGARRRGRRATPA